MTNFLKTAAAVAILGASGTAVSAANFGFQTSVQDDLSIELDLIRTDEAGVVVIYDYTGGEFGEVLGMTNLTAGANTDVIVTLDNNTAQELAAVVYSGDMSEPSMADNWIELDVKS